jgi:hypothetical protein
MNSLQSCIAAYVVGLVLMLGYAAHVWLGCHSRRLNRQPLPKDQLRATVVLGGRGARRAERV